MQSQTQGRGAQQQSSGIEHGKSQPSADEEIAQAPASCDRGAARAYEREEERTAPQSEAAEHLDTEKRKQPSGSDGERF